MNLFQNKREVKRKMDDRSRRFLILLYLHNKRNSLISRRRLIHTLELKLKKKARLLKICLEVLLGNINLLRNFPLLDRSTRSRSLGRYNCNNGWWSTFNTVYNEERFKQAFRVSRTTFNHILERILPFISKEDTGLGSVQTD